MVLPVGVLIGLPIAAGTKVLTVLAKALRTLLSAILLATVLTISAITLLVKSLPVLIGAELMVG